MSELDKLHLELKSADDKYKSLGKEKRTQAATILRAELIQKDKKISIEDQKVLDEFAAGNLQLDDLVAQFQGRI